MYIAIDFDGTCAEHEFPAVGVDVPGAADVLKELIEAGHDLILWTMRSGTYLDDARKWFDKHNLALFGVQTNPTQLEWTTSPKAYAHIYIDDAALGCPLIIPEDAVSRVYVDWVKVRQLLVAMGTLPAFPAIEGDKDV